MISVFFLICLFIFIAALYAHNISAVKPNKNLLLGVTLPFDSLQNSAVTEITERYHKAFKKLLLLFSAGALPILFVSQYVSLSIIYMFGWILLLIVLNERLLNKHSRQLLDLKKKNGWFIGNRNIVAIDTEVLKAKKKMPVSMMWFIPSIAVAILPLGISLAGNRSLGSFVLSILPIISVIVFFLIYRLTSSQRAAVYSNDTEINMALNLIYKRGWSVFSVIGSFMASILMLCMSLAIQSKNFNHAIIIMPPLVFSLSFIISAVSVKKHISARQGKILEASENILYTDDDDYWQGGVYNNPNDRRVMVEKRIGYGFSVNIATTGGKLFIYGTLGVVGVMLIYLTAMFINMDFGTFKLNVREQTAFIYAPLYDYSFDFDQITEITTVENIPSRIRTNGAETARYCLGHFNLDGYGASRLYINKNNPPYIVIRLKDGFVLNNGKTPEETQQYIELLR